MTESRRRRPKAPDPAAAEALAGAEDPAGTVAPTGSPDAGERHTAPEPESDPPLGQMRGRLRESGLAKVTPVFERPAPADPDRARIVPTGADELGRVAESVVAEDKAAAEHWDSRLWRNR